MGIKIAKWFWNNARWVYPLFLSGKKKKRKKDKDLRKGNRGVFKKGKSK